MPRRPPARVRAQQRRRDPYSRRRLRYYFPVPRGDFPRAITRIPGASSGLQAAIARLGRADPELGPYEIGEAYRIWRLRAYGPSRFTHAGAYTVCCEDCTPSQDRGTLEILLHRLPKRSARELRRLLAPLDEAYLDRTLPDPARDGPWWKSRI